MSTQELRSKNPGRWKGLDLFQGPAILFAILFAFAATERASSQERTPMEPDNEAAKLVERIQNMSSQVIQSLDQLIKSIKYKKCGSGSGQSPPQPKGSQEQENKPRDEQQDDSMKQNPQSQNEEGQEQDRPEDGRPEDDRGNRQAKDDPPPTDPERAEHTDVSGRWGVLPPKVQNDILNFNIEEFPQKYRKWLEEYYKRVNKQQDR
ncbi:MAG: hypothetical protein ACYTG7_17315 [Planctomycetota bacterium]|jgi:hypothetical protein